MSNKDVGIRWGLLLLQAWSLLSMCSLAMIAPSICVSQVPYLFHHVPERNDDKSIYIAEEISDSSLVLPRAIMWSVAPNAILGLLVILTLAFTSGDIEQVLQTRTKEPFIQIFYDVTQSKAAATVMASIVIILLCSCCFSEVATSSRQLWSFARDRGFPASSWLSEVCGLLCQLRSAV